MAPTLRFAFLFAGALGAPQAGHAQDIPPVVDSSWMNDMVLGSVMQEVAQESSRSVRTNTRPRQTASAASKLSFTPSPARRRENIARFVARTRASDPAGAAKMARLFASTDLIDAVGGEMRKIGLRPNNVEDAYAVWWVLSWFASNGVESDLKAATMAAVRAQSAAAIAETGQIEEASDAIKQEMVETLLVQAALVDGANEQMRGDLNKRRALAAAVNQGARKMGLDLTAMTLTANGFQPRKRGDAGQSLDAAGPQPAALAASGSEPDTSANNASDGRTGLALIAVRGAGPAAMFMAGRAWGRRG